MDSHTVYYSEGCPELLQARRKICAFSLARARLRLADAHRQKADDHYTAEHMSLVASEISDSRPLRACGFSHRLYHRGCNLLATCGLAGGITLFTCTTQPMQPVMQRCATSMGRSQLVCATDVAFSPSSVDTEKADLLAASYGDGTTKLWSLREVEDHAGDGAVIRAQLQKTFDGHSGSTATRLAFHPSSSYLATAGFDKTWRLWDVECGTQLLTQDGHSRSVYGLAFQCDGSLLASCGLDALTRVWDMRTGRSICALEGHVQAVYGVDFSPNGYHLATGSADQSSKIWDLRQQRLLYTIAAHHSLISRVKYHPLHHGSLLFTTSHDHTIKVWSGLDFKAITVLRGHEGPVAGVDLAPNGTFLATVGHDQSIKLWL
ncbi:hypothetical protein L7F22_022825 [Adiantum nelumboides]|nr:hypothetical protein [Adiantum nelumboides]